MWSDRSAFRRIVGHVAGGAGTNDIRAASEYRFKDLAARAGLHDDIIQFFIGKAREISVLHYAAFSDRRVEKLSSQLTYSLAKRERRRRAQA